MLAYTIGDSTKAGKAAEIKFYMQVPPSLQSLIILFNVYVLACVKCIIWIRGSSAILCIYIYIYIYIYIVSKATKFLEKFRC